MKAIFADFNAMTEAGHVSLMTRGSQDDIARLGTQPDDWVWLSDGELAVSAQLAIDDRHGLVGIADWETLVYLDEVGADHPAHVGAEIRLLAQKKPRSDEDERRMFELLAQLEHISPRKVEGCDSASLPLGRRQMGGRNRG
jgi:hypothetical protein